jgi:subfamily B ATP-binding cassette protein HlyB/CyaB
MLFITHGLPQGLKVDAVFRLTPKGAQAVSTASRFPVATKGNVGGMLRPVTNAEESQ